MNSRGVLQTNKTPKQKTASSQSPLYKKKLFKFVNQNQNSQEQSMHVQSKIEQPPPAKPSSKVVDFKQEIERRFQKAVGNREYVFPRRSSYDSSSDSSLASLTNVAQYDLHTQNFKKELPKKTVSESGPPSKPSTKYVNPKHLDLTNHFQQKFESKKILSVKDDILEDSSRMLTSLELKKEEKPRVESPNKNFLEKKLIARSETPTSINAVKSVARLSKGNKTNPASDDIRRLQKVAKTEPNESSLEMRQSNSQLSTKGSNKAPSTNNSKTINVSLTLNSKEKKDNHTPQLLSPHLVSPQDKKSFVAINNYGTVNNIINYNIYSTMQPVKSANDLRVNVSVPLKASIISSNKASYHSNKNSDILNGHAPNNHISKASSAYKDLLASINFSSSTTDKSLQSFKSSLHSEAEKVVLRNNYVSPKAVPTTTSNTKASGSTSRIDTLSTSREASKSQEKRKQTPVSSNPTSALYQKTQKDLLKRMKLNEGPKEQLSLQTLTYFPQTTRNLSKNSPKTPSSIKLHSPRITNLLATSSNLKTANKMMSNSVKMLTSSSKNLHALTNKTPIAREIHGVVNKTPTQRERPETKSTSANKSQGDLKNTQYPHLKKLLENNEARISLIKNDKSKGEKQPMRLDLRSITKTSGLYTERNNILTLRSDRKDKSSSEYY